jgi:hypothetical protein
MAMLRRLAAIVALVFLVACVSAKEYKGAVTKIDSDKKTVTVKVGSDEKTFAYSDASEFVGPKGAIPHDKLGKFAAQLTGAKGGVPATIETQEKDGKEVVANGHPVMSKLTLTFGSPARSGGKVPPDVKGQKD